MLLDYDDGKLGRYGVHGVPVDGAAMSIAPTSSYCGALWIECSKKARGLERFGVGDLKHRCGSAPSPARVRKGRLVRWFVDVLYSRQI